MATQDFKVTFSAVDADALDRRLEQSLKAFEAFEKRAVTAAKNVSRSGQALSRAQKQEQDATRANTRRQIELIEDATKKRLAKLDERYDRERQRAQARGEDLTLLEQVHQQRIADVRDRAAKVAEQTHFKNLQNRARAIEDANAREMALLHVKHEREIAAARRQGADLEALRTAQARESEDLAAKLDRQAQSTKRVGEETKTAYEQLGAFGERLEDSLKPLDDFHGSAGKVRAIMGGLEDIFLVLSGAVLIQLIDGIVNGVKLITKAWEDWSGQTDKIENDARRREMMLDRLKRRADDYRTVLQNVASAEQSAFGMQGILGAGSRAELLRIETDRRKIEAQLASVLADLDAGGTRGIGARLARAGEQATGRQGGALAAETEAQAKRLDRQARANERRGRDEVAEALRAEAAQLRAGIGQLKEGGEDLDARRERLDAERDRLSFALAGLQLERDKLIADAKKAAEADGLGTGSTLGAGAGGAGRSSSDPFANIRAGLRARAEFVERSRILGTDDGPADPLQFLFGDSAGSGGGGAGDIARLLGEDQSSRGRDRQRAFGLLAANEDVDEDIVEQERYALALQALQEQQQAERDLAQQHGDDMLLLESTFEQQRTQLREDFAERRKQAALSEAKAIISTAQGFIAASEQIADSLNASDGVRALIRRGMNIAQAAEGIAEGIGGNPVGFAKAAAHTAAALDFLRVANKAGKGGGGSGSSSGGGTALPTSTSAPGAGDLPSRGGQDRGPRNITVRVDGTLLDEDGLVSGIGRGLREAGEQLGHITRDMENAA